MLRQLRNNQRGATLVEMIIVVTLFAFISVVALSFLTSVSRSYARVNGELELAEEAGAVMQHLVVAARAARDFEANSDLAVDLAATPGTSVSFDEPVAGHDPTVFSVTAGTLYMAVGLQSPVALTAALTAVDSLIITDYSSADALSRHAKIELVLSRPNPGGSARLVFPITTAVEFRLP